MTNARFNLMPHRAQARKDAWRIFARQSLVTAGLAIVFSLTGMMLINLSASKRVAFNHTLDSAIQSLQPRVQESIRLDAQYQSMLQRQKIIEDLDARRSTSVLILNDLASALPREVYLTRLFEDGARFTLEGKSMDPSAIARFLEKLSASSYLYELNLGEIRLKEQESMAPYGFILSGKVRLANATEQKSMKQTSAP